MQHGSAQFFGQVVEMYTERSFTFQRYLECFIIFEHLPVFVHIRGTDVHPYIAADAISGHAFGLLNQQLLTPPQRGTYNEIVIEHAAVPHQDFRGQ